MTFDVADELISVLHSSANTAVRVGAAEGLGELGEIKALEPLRKVMKSSENSALRAAAARALGRAAYLCKK